MPLFEPLRLLFKNEININLTFENKNEKKMEYIKAQFGNCNGVGRISDTINMVIPNLFNDFTQVS